MSGFEVIFGDAVVLEYSKLVAGEDLTEEIGRAYGADGLGILTVNITSFYFILFSFPFLFLLFYLGFWYSWINRS